MLWEHTLDWWSLVQCSPNLSVMTEDNFCKFGALLHWTSSCLDATSFSNSPQLPAGQHDGISRLPLVGCCGSATRETSLWQDGLVTCPASDERKHLVAVNKIIRPAFYGSANFTDAQNPSKYQMEINEQSLAKVKQLYLHKNLHTQFDIFTKWTWQEHSISTILWILSL